MKTPCSLSVVRRLMWLTLVSDGFRVARAGLLSAKPAWPDTEARGLAVTERDAVSGDSFSLLALLGDMPPGDIPPGDKQPEDSPPCEQRL
jgi:hypothetical protein